MSTSNSIKTDTQPYTPVLNKLFMNKLRGLIQKEFAFRNIDRTKKDLLQKYGVPKDSKIYNYKQSETRKISMRYPHLFPQQVAQDIKVVNRFKDIALTALTLVGVVFYGGGFYFERRTKWGRLTASAFLPKVLMWTILLNASNYFMLVHNSEEIDLIFKHHVHYQKAIDTYQQEIL